MPKAKGAKAGGKKTGPRGSYMDPRDTTRTLGQEGITKHTADREDRVHRLVVPLDSLLSCRHQSDDQPQTPQLQIMSNLTKAVRETVLSARAREAFQVGRAMM